MASPVDNIPCFPPGADVKNGFGTVGGPNLTQLDPSPNGTDLVYGMWISCPQSNRDFRVATRNLPKVFALYVRRQTVFFLPIRNTNDAWFGGNTNANTQYTWMAG